MSGKDLAFCVAMVGMLCGACLRDEWTVVAAVGALVVALAWISTERVVAVRADEGALELLTVLGWRRLRWEEIGQIETYARAAPGAQNRALFRIDVRSSRPGWRLWRLTIRADLLPSGPATLESVRDVATSAGASVREARNVTAYDEVVTQPVLWWAVLASYLLWLGLRSFAPGGRFDMGASAGELGANWVALVGTTFGLLLGTTSAVLEWAVVRARLKPGDGRR